jgi:hypothetical protein
MRSLVSLVLALWFLGACSSGDSGLPKPAPTSTPASSDPYTRITSPFRALPDATAYNGELNGGVFKIEMPDNWNGDLVLYFAGSHQFAPDLWAENGPAFGREHLIENGYAWATTSYNTNEPISGDEAQQAAVLWDYFAKTFGEPGRTYAMGDSGGADGVLVAVERYANRFDGGLVGCGVSGVFPSYDVSADKIAAGAYAAGISKAEFESSVANPQKLGALFGEIWYRIDSDEQIRFRFIELWTLISGGPRAFVSAGYDHFGRGAWTLPLTEADRGRADNADRQYDLQDSSLFDESDFNARAVRLTRISTEVPSEPGDPTGDIDAPVIFLHTTGDWMVPLSELQLSLQRITDKEKAHLARARTFGRARHCAFSQEEYTSAFDALVDWVENEREPPSEYQTAASLVPKK